MVNGTRASPNCMICSSAGACESNMSKGESKKGLDEHDSLGRRSLEMIQIIMMLLREAVLPHLKVKYFDQSCIIKFDRQSFSISPILESQ